MQRLAQLRARDRRQRLGIEQVVGGHAGLYLGGVVLDRATADALREAFVVINGIRFEHHAAQVQAGTTPDNLLEPDALAPIARSDLREALHVVRRAQKRIGAWSPPS